LGIGPSFQITNIFPTLTVLENIRLASQALGNDNFRLFRSHRHFRQYEERAWEVIKQVGLTERALMPARTLPHGDQRKLELGMILAPEPELLLLDEPTAGNKTVMLVEHNMNVVMNVSDTITVMHHGQVLAEGTPAEITANETVQQAYLGALYA
jgi:branched-chain amino acid transport system ATP-binding protein